MRLVAGVVGTELLSEVQARCDNVSDPAPYADWLAEARIAADFGLLVLKRTSSDPVVTRTAFGDAWAAAVDSSESVGRADGRWPLPGPGKYDVDFFPMTKRPAFPIFAMTGPTVAAVRQGGWNLDLGFGRPSPNPVTQVEMRSTLRDGTTVSVQTETGERWALPALRVSDLSSHRAITEQLLLAMNDRSAPWQVRPVQVDGAIRELLVLDLDSDALPAGVVGPNMIAVGQIKDAHVTIVCDDPNIDLNLATISPEDLLG